MSDNKSIIEKLKKADLSSENVLNDLLDMCVYVKDEDLDYAIDTAQIVKNSAAKNVRYNSDLELVYYRTLLFLAPYDLDSYLIYMEKDREPQSRFYLPRRKQLRKIGLVQTLQELEVTDNLDLVSISVIPGAGKTTLAEFFMSWVAGRHPEKYSLFVSHSGDITRMFYDAINDITSSDEYKWGEIFPHVKRESENAKVEQINWGKYKPFKTIQCTSVGSKNAGKVRCNNYLYCDDLIGNIEEALSKPRLDKLWSTYSVDLRQRKKEGCKELHIATRWSVHDVIGRLKVKFSNSDRARFIEIPDIDPETGESNFDYDYGVGFSIDYFHDMEETMDDISYKCLFKSEPIEREGLLYHEEDLRRYASLPTKEPDAVLGICDTKDKGTDFMFLPAMYQYGNDFYMVDCICDDNADYGIQYSRCANIIVVNRMQQCKFESNNGGSRVGYDVNKIVESKGWHCNITDETTTQNKETKIIVNADWVKKHVLFREKEDYTPKSDYGKAMGWLLSYSLVGKNQHDDVPDGLAQFALFVQNLYGISKQARIMNSPM